MATARTLTALGVVLMLGARLIVAQARDSTAASPFDPLARRVLTLKLQTEALRGRLAHLVVPDAAWSDSLAAMQSGVNAVHAAARRLAASYQRARHDQGVKLAAQLLALAARVDRSLDTLSRAGDPRATRTALTHLSAALEALNQKIAEGETCCQTDFR